MKTKTILLAIVLLLGIRTAHAEEDYKTSATYLALRDSMHHAFNDGDSARFFPALKNLQDYLYQQGNMHAYYTQRCNEIIFLMNAQKIFEAYKLARQLSKELREKKLDKEMYMAVNMMGHINRYCGNKEAAKQCFFEVIRLMEKEGYYSSEPPIYMNIVNVALDDNPEEADFLLEKARAIAEKYSPERVFDIETRRTLSYYNRGDIPHFLEGYKAYKEGEKEGRSSVHGRSMEVYYLASQGKIDEAVKMAQQELGDDGIDAIPLIYERAGRWQDAYKALKKEYEVNDSVVNVVLTNSMEGIQDELKVYEAERQVARNRTIAFAIVFCLLVLLIIALMHIVQSRRKHLKELQKAYDKAMESEKMKTAFIQNVSHEVRTPLNIISGFSQVIADPELTDSVEERQRMANMMQKSSQQITSLIDEIIGLSLIETSDRAHKDDAVKINSMLKNVIVDYKKTANENTTLQLQSTLSDDFVLNTNLNMLRRIMSALTDNAVKYTEKGTVTLKAEADEQKVTISVEDTGCGIPVNEAENIFGRFVKLNSFKEGIGLGLPLSRKLAQQLGGDVKLDTNYTQGARFIVTIPI